MIFQYVKLVHLVHDLISYFTSHVKQNWGGTLKTKLMLIMSISWLPDLTLYFSCSCTCWILVLIENSHHRKWHAIYTLFSRCPCGQGMRSAHRGVRVAVWMTGSQAAMSDGPWSLKAERNSHRQHLGLTGQCSGEHTSVRVQARIHGKSIANKYTYRHTDVHTCTLWYCVHTDLMLGLSNERQHVWLV